jgi:Uncharacterized protein conserved in bacteria (DUF2188)
MGFDQKGASEFCVARGKSGQWEVTEKGFEKPLASFDTLQDAEVYARDLAQTKEGSTVKVFDERGTQMPAEGSAPMPPPTAVSQESARKS